MNIAGRVNDTKSNEEAGRPLQSDRRSAAPASASGRLIDPWFRRRPAENGKDLHVARLDIEVCVDQFIAISTESVPVGVS